MLVGSNRSITVSKSHNYTKENVILGEKLLAEWGQNQRNFSLDKIIEVYNQIKGVKENKSTCKSCDSGKFLIAIKNYVKYGRLVLQNEGVIFDKEEKIIPDKNEFSPERVNTGIEQNETPELKEVKEVKKVKEAVKPKTQTKKTTNKKK
jgi:hypothetical protein